MRNRRHVFDQADVDACRLQRAQCRLPPRSRTPNENLHTAQTVIHRFFGRAIGRLLGGEGRAFARSAETAGWLAIEDATRKFKVRLRGEALERGERITSRMGPGYSYKVAGRMHTWSLEEQRGLFALFEGAATPAQLMASCAMTPKLSRSGLYGLAPTDESTPRSDT